MTEQIKSAIKELEFDMECGEFYNPSMADSVELAINSLKTWEEVLEELEELKENVMELNTEYYIGKSIGLKEAIDIINQKLAEIEE